ncbi:unnamed protein product [Brachionus calyciflorus]|uniref:RING-type domain-containing protein n=1 Tax=Brachionus calyciflorus TaxID=104777 RepID=A0A814DEG4_9BILA|nr:unnamed protein product [Brachionus calyciflorus]
MNQLDDILNCSICLDRYKEPKILPCHHSFCAECINRLKINGSVTCPNCRLVHDASKDFLNDFRTNQLLDLKNQELTQNRENFRLVQPSAPLANEFNENLVIKKKSKDFFNDFRTNQLLDLNNHKESTQNRETSPLVKPSAPIENELFVPNQNHRQENDKKKEKKIFGKIFFIIIIALIAIIFFIVFILYPKNSTINYFCNASQYWDGGKCLEKSHYREYCKSSFECNDMKSLSCINNSCKT